MPQSQLRSVKGKSNAVLHIHTFCGSLLRGIISPSEKIY